MANEILKSRHAFGPMSGVDQALTDGKIDAYDILFLTEGDEHKIGWVDKDGNKVILEGKKQVTVVDVLPESGNVETIYICGTTLYFWDGSAFVSVTGTGGVSEETVDTKVANGIASANAYTDEKIASAVEIVEF